MYKQNKSESGQILIIVVVGIIALLGFTALAIDGSIILTERRNSQKAADAAAMAGALQKSNEETNNVAITAAINAADINGYTITSNDVTITGPVQGAQGQYYLVKVDITHTIETSFAHLVAGDIANSTSATARVQFLSSGGGGNSTPMPGYSIITLRDCTTSGGNNVTVSGGGNSGGIIAHNGSIFVNSPETSGNDCAIDPPSSAGNDGIVGDTGIFSVGTHNYSGESKISPSPITTGANGGSPISDPFGSLPEPVCNQSGSKSGGVYQPGNWNGGSLGAGEYAPGIYCITGELAVSGNASKVIRGDGVLLYFISGGTRFTGNASMQITAPNGNNCTGTAGDPSSSCTYANMAVFMSRSNTSTFEVRGNGANAIYGTVYAPASTVMGRGGGSSAEEIEVWGQVIADSVDNRGNGSLDVYYENTLTVSLITGGGALISLEQ